MIDVDLACPIFFSTFYHRFKPITTDHHGLSPASISLDSTKSNKKKTENNTHITSQSFSTLPHFFYPDFLYLKERGLSLSYKKVSLFLFSPHSCRRPRDCTSGNLLPNKHPIPEQIIIKRLVFFFVITRSVPESPPGICKSLIYLKVTYLREGKARR